MKTFALSSRTLPALLVVVAILVGGAALAQHAQHAENGQVRVAELCRRDIVEQLHGKAASATVLEVTFEPGQKDTPHRHAGPAFGYVLEGEYEHAIDDEAVKTYKAGETFYEPSGACTGWHRIRAARPGRACWWCCCTLVM